MELVQIAVYKSQLKEKFGIPRQSGLAPAVRGRIVFEPQFRDANALRGLDGFSHIWLIWGFSANHSTAWSPTVRPPRLGGNTAIGVFASRSPYRPNPLGLSSVKIERIVPDGPEGPEIQVLGADLMDGTPIYDIKPYVTYADSHPGAKSGFVDAKPWQPLQVVFAPGVPMPSEQDKEAIVQILEQDPRPQYQNDDRTYGLTYGSMNIRFTVNDSTLTVIAIEEK